MNKIFTIVGAIVVVGGLILGGLWAFDIGVGATIEGKRCVAGEIDIKTQWFGAETTLTDVPAQQCAAIQNGNFVEYHIRSERTSIWASEGGQCIWDTEHGPAGCDK